MMDKELIDQLWNRATRETLNSGALNERYRFAKLVRDDYSNKHAQLWLKRIDEARAEEREACAKLFPEPHKEYFGRDIQDAIRARGEA